jgi:hypothetical protein
MKEWRAKSIYHGLTGTLGNDAYRPSPIKIWLKRFESDDLCCNDLPRARRPLSTLGPQLEGFLQKHPIASAGVTAHLFFTTVATVKDILQRELGMRKTLTALGAACYERCRSIRRDVKDSVIIEKR